MAASSLNLRNDWCALERGLAVIAWLEELLASDAFAAVLRNSPFVTESAEERASSRASRLEVRESLADVARSNPSAPKNSLPIDRESCFK